MQMITPDYLVTVMVYYIVEYTDMYMSATALQGSPY